MAGRPNVPAVKSRLEPPAAAHSNNQGSVGLFRHCDLGRFQPDGRGGVVFLFDTFIQPNPVAGGLPPNLLVPGDYRVELMLSSDNAKPVTKRWALSFAGPWSDDEETLLRQIQLTEV